MVGRSCSFWSRCVEHFVCSLMTAPGYPIEAWAPQAIDSRRVRLPSCLSLQLGRDVCVRLTNMSTRYGRQFNAVFSAHSYANRSIGMLNAANRSTLRVLWPEFPPLVKNNCSFFPQLYVRRQCQYPGMLVEVGAIDYWRLNVAVIRVLVNCIRLDCRECVINCCWLQIIMLLAREANLTVTSYTLPDFGHSNDDIVSWCTSEHSIDIWTGRAMGQLDTTQQSSARSVRDRRHRHLCARRPDEPGAKTALWPVWTNLQS